MVGNKIKMNLNHEDADYDNDGEEDYDGSVGVGGGGYDNSGDALMRKLNALKEEFYTTDGNKKKGFFKKSQKEACARSVSNQICEDDAIAASFFAMNKGTFYLNYPLMKMYMNNDNYMRITDKLIDEIACIVANNYPDPVRVHINLNGFTVSAAERYKHVLEYFSRMCNEKQIVLTPFIENVFIYYTPSVMSSIMDILKFFIEPDIQNRLVLIAKDQSEVALSELFATRDEKYLV